MRISWVFILFTLLFTGCVQPDDGLQEPLIHVPVLATCEEPVTITFLHVPDRPPSEFALEGMQEELEKFLPPCSFAVAAESRNLDPGPDGHWSEEELEGLDEASRLEFEDGRRVIIHYLDGEYDEPSKAYTRYRGEFGPSTVYMFIEEKDESDSVPMLGDQARERGTLLHELGHAFGLVGRIPMVNDRLPTASQDACRCHSTNPESVMYYRAHGGNPYLDELGDGESDVFRFDEDDLLDLRSAREAEGLSVP